MDGGGRIASGTAIESNAGAITEVTQEPRSGIYPEDFALLKSAVLRPQGRPCLNKTGKTKWTDSTGYIDYITS